MMKKIILLLIILFSVTTAFSQNIKVPKFKYADVQEVANEYASFIKDYSDAIKDPGKAAEMRKRAQKWALKIEPAMKKLQSDSREMKKFTDFMQAAAAKMTKYMQQNK